MRRLLGAASMAALTFVGADVMAQGLPSASSPSATPTASNGAPPPAPEAAPAEPPLEAGGLTPPGAGADYVPPPSPETDLMRADREDSKRGLEFVWLNGEVGFQYLGLQTFAANDLVDASVVETNQSGLMVGAGLGVRLVFLTLGPRFRYGSFQDFKVWTLDGELGIRIPLGKLEPYFTFAAGYASLGSLDFGNAVDGGDAKIRGFNGRLGFGLDYYLSNAVSVGATAGAEALFLRRPGVKLSNPSTAEDVYAADGSSIGLGLSGAAVIGLHF